MEESVKPSGHSVWDPRVLQSREQVLGADGLSPAASTQDEAAAAMWAGLHTHRWPLVKPHTVTGRPSLWASPAFIHHIEDLSVGEDHADRHWSTERSWEFVNKCLLQSIEDPRNILAHTYRKG